MKILAFGASSSRNSINQKLAVFAASLVEGAEVTAIDLNDFEMPIYSEDKEAEHGLPDRARAFIDLIRSADGIVVSYAEHNGTYTAAYKNLFDWASRVERSVYQNKPMVFLSAAPGASGGASVLAQAMGSVQFFGVDLQEVVCVPRFFDVFDVEANRVTDPDLLQSLVHAMAKLASRIRQVAERPAA